MHDTWFERVEDDDELDIIEEVKAIVAKMNLTSDVDELAQMFARIELLNKLLKNDC
jgi:hypothetical protein